MASPILLGGMQVLWHGLGANGSAVVYPGGWSGTFGPGWIPLFNWNVGIAHPDGGVLYGRTSFVCYGPPGGTIEGAVQIDGGGVVGYGRHFFNNQVFGLFCFTFNSLPWGRLAQGSHNIISGCYCEGGQVIFDQNCGGVSLVEEMPA